MAMVRTIDMERMYAKRPTTREGRSSWPTSSRLKSGGTFGEGSPAGTTPTSRGGQKCESEACSLPQCDVQPCSGEGGASATSS